MQGHLFTFALVVFGDVVLALPTYDTSFLGYEYWNKRCKMNYKDDWLGFWNNWSNGRTHYKRSNTVLYSRSCPSGCDCSNDELDCTKFTRSVLSASRMYRSVSIIRNGQLPDNLEEIMLIKVGLKNIEQKVFYNVTGLKILNLGENSLTEIPDVSMNNNLEKLILDHNQIEIIIENVTALPESLKELVLLGNKIKFIPDRMFNLPNLQRISLSKNELVRFPEFYNPKKLEFISVDQNKIKSITYTSLQVFFGNNSQLKHLNLSNNEISYMPPEALSNLFHLKILELHVNKIASIDAQVFYKIPQLCHLDLRGNNLKVITASGYTPAFEDLPELKTLVLTEQTPAATTVMYNAFKNLPKLKHLWLDQNALKHFPNPAFSQEEWPSIKELHIESNRLTTFSSYSSSDFPPDMMVLWSSLRDNSKPFAKMKTLEKLMVHMNDIDKVEEKDLWELNNLKELYLSRNKLTEERIHPEAFRNMSLAKLHLDAMKGIGIQYVPDITQQKSRLPDVTEIDLSNNKITFLLNGSFSALDTLITLRLGTNSIVSAETGTFPKSITHIYLESNHFDFRHPDIFSNLPSLRTLNLYQNKISYLPDNALHGLEQLSTLNLASNAIGRILKVAFKDLKKLSNLRFSNNELSFIEEGTFTAIDRTLGPTLSIDLSNNHLTLLPAQGDFSNLEIRDFDVRNNRLTRIRSRTFANVKCSASQTWSFYGNDIVEIEEESFVNITENGCIFSFKNGAAKNPLKSIASRAFNNVRARAIYLDELELRTLRSETFKQVRLGEDLRLQSNSIDSIEVGAFDTVIAKYLHLQNNKIKDISGKIFGSGSAFTDLDLRGNEIKSLHEDSFDDLTISGEIFLLNNKLVIFPEKALQKLNPPKLDLRNNFIPSLPAGSLDGLTNLIELNLGNNNISKLEKNVFQRLTKLKKLNLEDSGIAEIEEGAFSNLEQIQDINLRNNKVGMLGTMVFSNLPKLTNLQLSGNPLECGCNVFNTLDDVIQSIRSAGKCAHPARVRGVTFPGTYKAHLRRDFTCAPVNLTASAPNDFQLRVDWTPTTYSYAIESRNGTNGTSVIVPDNFTTLNISYEVTCLGPANQVITGTTNLTWILFGKKDGILAGSDYSCFVRTVEVSRSNGSTQAVSRTSVDSQSVFQTTIEGKAPVSNTTNASNYYLDITYYDFSASEPDFVSGRYEGNLANPRYISSPYGSWLSRPGYSTYSDWFRSESTRNKHYTETLQLTLTHERDGKGNPIHRYFSPEFFPVDGRGFRAEGQRDCKSRALRNYGFTAAARNTFIYTGHEILTFAGGEELFVFVNKQLLVQLFHEPNKNTTVTPCAVLELSPAQGEDGGNITWQAGFLVGESCENTQPSGTKVYLKLVLGFAYRLDVFLAERFLCESTFLFQTSGVSFVQPWQRQRTKPVDYVTEVSESLHVGAVLQEFVVGDEFTTGPYTVAVLTGNEQRRFGVESSSYSPPSSPGPEVNETVTIGGETVLLCPNASNVTQPIAVVSVAVETFTFPSGDTEAFLSLRRTLDYEATKDYELLIEITDTNSGRQGNITIKILVLDVNDNCPILPKVSYDFAPVPPLTTEAFFTIKATDLDSGEKSKISYYPLRISGWSKVSRNRYDTKNFTEVVWVNKTVEITWTYRIYAVDNGVPRRGDYIPVNVTINATCSSHANFVINDTTGEVFLRAPHLTVSEYPLNSTDKPMCRRCRTGFFCVGDGTEKPCGISSPTEYSFGGASKCEDCPVGWLCHNGTALPCPDDTWVVCNKTFCPDKCNPCEPGTVCFNGKQTDCLPGTYSDGTGFPCKLCPPGSFNNAARATTCACCPAGFTSTYQKNSCRACHAREWAEEGVFPNCGLCKTCATPSQCPCLAMPSPCFPGVLCRNLAYGKYKCGDCLDGYEGNGTHCVDIDECTRASPCYNSTCINLTPGYRCGGCPVGHRGSAPSGIGLKQAINTNQTCKDIDECLEGGHVCDVNSKCINTIGSYKCGACNVGYVGNGYAGCTPGDFCDDGAHDCHSNATCTSQGSGRYTCTCKDGFAGDGRTCGPDDDMDGIPTEGLSCLDRHCKQDNCPYVPNESQNDNDQDSDGDACDPDDDNDNIEDEQDNCQFTINANQTDSDGDGVGDVCDNCIAIKNTDQRDRDGDGTGDECDDDIDGDGILNRNDKCPSLNTTDQSDRDGDSVGDACDNCISNANTNQADSNQNGYGDVCDAPGSDRDGDSVYNDYDNCVDLPNAEQANKDGDKLGDACDEDSDSDGVLNNVDNCPLVQNLNQNHDDLIFDANGAEVGDMCNKDFDGDRVFDFDDSCPSIANIQRTSFSDHFTVSLDSSPGTSEWRISNQGRDVEQVSNSSGPSMLIGQQRYGPVNYSGTIFVNTDQGSNYIGIVLGYQSNRKFYVVMWRKENSNLDDNTYKAGIKGIQMKLVNSDSGPSTALARALWHSGDTANQVSLLWHDPLMQGWQHNTPYRFYLQHRPSVGKIRLTLKERESVLADSGDIYDTTIAGGHLGLFVYRQNDVIWSRLQANCEDRKNRALVFDGENDSVLLHTVEQLQLTDSFTISGWVKMASAYPTSSMPAVCTLDTTICLFIKDRRLHGKFGDVIVFGSEVIEADDWHHVALRYDAQRHQLEIFLNASTEGKVANVKPLSWASNPSVYLGRDMIHFFKGELDDVSFWPVKLPDNEVKDYAKMAGLSWPKHKGLVRAHYTMDQRFGSNLTDESGNKLDGSLKGSPRWVESSLDKVRFQLSYPNNRKRRSAALLHTEL